MSEQSNPTTQTGYNALYADELISNDRELYKEQKFLKKFCSEIKRESNETGVIYKITNKKNGLFYIGKTISYRKDGSAKGAYGRFIEHIATANYQNTTNKPLDCPIFYPLLLESEKADWRVETLLIAKHCDLKKFETMAIEHYKSYLPSIGLNFFIADNKPPDGVNNIQYTTRKAQCNRNRAQNGKLKRNDLGLPENIYLRNDCVPQRNGKLQKIEGYFVQIKIPNVPMKETRKGFSASSKSMEEKLNEAKEWLKLLKEKHGLV